MPLFYFLSGIFYKDCKIQGLLKKRCKSLLVPFFVFYVFTSLMLPAFIYKVFGYTMMYYESLDVCNILFSFITTEIFPNPPIWFLLSLFEVIFLFCLIRKIKNVAVQMGLVAIIAFIGLGCAMQNFYLWGYIDTSFTALPFYASAFYVFRNQWLKERFFKQNLPAFYIGVIGLLLITRYIHFDYRINQYNHICLIYPLGFLGTYLVIQASLKLRSFNVINFIGKNSMPILCTHFIIIDYLQYVVDWIWGADSHLSKPLAIFVFIFTMLLEYFVIIPNKELPKKCFNKIINIVYAKN